MSGFARGAYIVPRLLRQFAVLLAIGTAPAMAQTTVETLANIAYGPLPAEQADLYLPAAPASHRPAVVVIHGGGWVSGSRHANDYFSSLLASMGVVVLNIDYRLADKALPETRWPAQLVDAQLAVRFLRAHASGWSIDPARLGAVGDSAGAQLAVFLGTLPHIVPGDEAALYPRERPGVQAVVDQFGPMDLPGMGTYGQGSIEAMFGTAAPPPEALLTASPLPDITAHTAPMYIIHAEGDRVVPIDASRQLAAALKAHHVPYEWVQYEGDHAFGGLNGDQVGKLQIPAMQWLVARLQR